MYKHYALQQIYVKIFKKFKSTDCQNLEAMKNHYLNLQLVLFFALVVTDWRYVFVADFGARHCQATMKFEASHRR